MKLYSYYRSSAAYRVRIALNIKNIQHTIAPCLDVSSGEFIFQSAVMIDYLVGHESQPGKSIIRASPGQTLYLQLLQGPSNLL
jgi:glutathione S-transferase